MAGNRLTHVRKITDLQRDVQALQETLGTLISWLPQSANSPIRVDEAERLLQILHPTRTQTPMKHHPVQPIT